MKITGSLEVLSQYTCEYFDAEYEYDYLNVSSGLSTSTSTEGRYSISLLASLYNPIVNLAMVSTVRFYDRNELYGSPDVRNCRMPNFLGSAFFIISLISIN